MALHRHRTRRSEPGYGLLQSGFAIRIAEGPADERCHHRVTQIRVPLSQIESAKDSGHYQRLDDNDGKPMSDADDTFTKATDNLIALYRSVERSTLNLPLVSLMPFLVFF